MRSETGEPTVPTRPFRIEVYTTVPNDMGKVSREQLQQLAALAHLSLSEDELESLSADLEQILDYAERLQKLDTEGVAPTSHALLAAGSAEEDALRDDEPTPGLDRQKVLDAAPDDGDGLFKVPRVLS